MNRTTWTPTLAWLAAATAALVLAMAGPSETGVMGQLPMPAAKRLQQQRVELPRGLSADRTLALVAFSREQRGEIDSWINGLRLDHDPAIPWIKMPVINDPGSDDARSIIESRLAARHPENRPRSRLMPVFTDRQAFIRAAGLSGTGRASVLILNREGKVLARAEGAFDEDKAQALRETLVAQGE